MITKPSWSHDLAHVCRGLLMGGADIIPGVSGGTVALILGIYERLVTALSHFDLVLIGRLRHRQWSAAAAHVDLRFLVALGTGIVLGIGGLAGLMHYLLDQHAVLAWSFLFGLILASSVLVALMVERWRIFEIVGAAAGAAFAYWLVGQLPAVPPAGYGYLFLCGTLAICAMILPGISGAFVLVILGMYFHVTGVLRSLISGEITASNILTVLVFASGCAVGLLSFSKFLRWLLNRYETLTMAVLCGFMIGSLRKIWPFKAGVPDDMLPEGISPEELEKLRQYRLGHNILPDQFNGELFAAIALALAGIAIVVALDRLTRVHEHIPPLEALDHEPELEES